jgi:predicted phosphodiesterase
MRALILSDIHANMEALTAVLADAQGRSGFDVIWCLGDTVGYGPDPGPCVDLLRRHDLRIVAGNHDHAAVGLMGVEEFNDAAAAAALWTARQLSPEQAAFLAGLPLVVTEGAFTLVHGSLRSPLWEYLLDGETARTTFDRLTTQFCLVGHSHIPFICQEDEVAPRFVEFTEDQVFPLGDARWIVNPGGVGQPRDRDPRASYGLYDSRAGTLERHRAAYDIPGTQLKMRLHGLPEPLARRLEYGV